jgi:hypothetical protein
MLAQGRHTTVKVSPKYTKQATRQIVVTGVALAGLIAERLATEPHTRLR